MSESKTKHANINNTSKMPNTEQRLKMAVSMQNLIAVFAPNLVAMINKVNKKLAEPVKFILDELFSLSYEVGKIFTKQIASYSKVEKKKLKKLDEKYGRLQDDWMIEKNLLENEREEFRQNGMESNMIGRNMRNKILNFGDVMEGLRREIEFERLKSQVIKEENSKITALIKEMRGYVNQGQNDPLKKEDEVRLVENSGLNGESNLGFLENCLDKIRKLESSYSNELRKIE